MRVRVDVEVSVCFWATVEGLNHTRTRPRTQYVPVCLSVCVSACACDR